MEIKQSLLLISLLISLNFYSQIKVKEINKIGDTIVTKPISYDGISDFTYQENFENYRQYIGYDIFVNKSMVLYCDKKSNSKDLYNKTYKIIDINFRNDTILNKIRNLELEKDYEKRWDFLNFSEKIVNSSDPMTILFKLEDKETKEIFYANSVISNDSDKMYKNYKYQKLKFNKFHSGFIFVPFYEYIKGKYNDKELILLKEPNGWNFKDLYTEKNVQNLKLSKWKCKVEVMNAASVPVPIYSYFELHENQIFFSLTNSKGENVALPKIVNDDFVFVSIEEYNDILNENKLDKIQKEKIEREKLALKNAELNKIKRQLENNYGLELASLILNHNVKIGMNREICELSWGKPIYKSETINQNGTYEVWNYWGNLKLTFINDKLVEIKK